MSEYRPALQRIINAQVAIDNARPDFTAAQIHELQWAHAVAKALLALPEQQSWTCFHCGEVFTERESAREHFGNSQTREAECAIDIAEYRRMEEVSMRHLQEDTELHRALIAKECEMHRAVRSSEEEGYERGLRDAKLLARPEPDDSLADTATPKAQSGTWTLVAPDGRQWKGESPLKVTGAEMRERVPAEVGLARILREVSRPEPDERCKHGVRLPHECKECVYEAPMEEVRAWQKQQSAEAKQVARPDPAPTYTVNPAPDAAAPMSPGKTFTAVATYKGMPFSRPEPEPRITREWQPIESAPNGKSVLCFWPAVKRNDVNHEAYQGQAWKRFGNWFRTSDGYGAATDMVNDPTHWRPLPSPPTASDGERE